MICSKLVLIFTVPYKWLSNPGENIGFYSLCHMSDAVPIHCFWSTYRTMAEFKGKGGVWIVI